jgi:hypothetical protein
MKLRLQPLAKKDPFRYVMLVSVELLYDGDQ